MCEIWCVPVSYTHLTGSHEEKMVKVREVREKIKAQVKMFAEQKQLSEK